MKHAKNKKFNFEKIKTVFALAVICLSFVLLGCYLSSEDQKMVDNYNNGLCSDCGHYYDTEYEYFEKGDGRWMTHFECSNCGHRGAAPSDMINSED